MKSLTAIFLFFTISIANAEITGIYDLWEPDGGEHFYLILANNGRVYEVSKNNSFLINKLKKAANSKRQVELIINVTDSSKSPDDQRATIIDANILKYKSYSPFPSYFYSSKDDDEEDVVVDEMRDDEVQHDDTLTKADRLTSMSQANGYFNTMRSDTRNRSQCYNRAKVWAYELWKYYSLTTLKNWMFFTRRYIREYRYHWWFHVTPATIVNGVGVVALDRKFMKEATDIVKWKNFFMRNDAPCALVSYYSTYRNNQEARYCYWIRTNMYFWQPYHIENLENGWAPRDKWLANEINAAYKDAL